MTTCGKCGHSWSGLSMCHCAACCQPGHGELSTFASVDLFDRHRSAAGEHGSCLSPVSLRGRDGQPVMFFRNGYWRGPERDGSTIPTKRGAA